MKKVELARRLGFDKSYITKISKEQVSISASLYNKILNELKL